MAKPERGVREKWWNDVVSVDIANYYEKKEDAESGNKSKGSLIWGDRVRILESENRAGVVKVSARGREMWMRASDLGGIPLLELYFIDVGQGDGILVVTPQGHHVLIDGGDIRSRQQGGKNAADFVDWKFSRDYLSYDERRNGNPKIQLDAMIASHCDQDHFGGLYELLNITDQQNRNELTCDSVEIEAIYHAGLSWWKTGSSRKLGPILNDHYVKLLGGRESAISATQDLENSDGNTLNGNWGKFIRAATATRRASDSQKFSTLKRLSNKTDAFLPGFNQSNSKTVGIRVLGPIEHKVSGKSALKKLTGGSNKNTNGHSIVLRIDYDNRRILLTGDLNTEAQNEIMNTYGPRRFKEEFKCDVAKGCHHGSQEVSYAFLKGLQPVATVISSGDAETYDHPRPSVVSASALTGRCLLDGDSLVAPLIYMTEIARSVTISECESVKLVKGVRYGLVNVRTDGKKLFFAVKEEKGDKWSYTVLSDDQIDSATRIHIRSESS